MNAGTELIRLIRSREIANRVKESLSQIKDRSYRLDYQTTSLKNAIN